LHVATSNRCSIFVLSPRHIDRVKRRMCACVYLLCEGHIVQSLVRSYACSFTLCALIIMPIHLRTVIHMLTPSFVRSLARSLAPSVVRIVIRLHAVSQDGSISLSPLCFRVKDCSSNLPMAFRFSRFAHSVCTAPHAARSCFEFLRKLHFKHYLS